MHKTLARSWRPHDILISFIVLALLVGLTYGLLFGAPYQGFYFNPTDGQVLVIHPTGESTSALQVGDFIERVGAVPFDVYYLGKTPFFSSKAQPGESVEIVVRRGDERLTIPWEYPGFNQNEFQTRFYNVWWLAYIFWFVGMSTQLFMRPKDRRWGLFVASNYLIGLFIMLGSVSSYRIFASALLLRSVAWLLLPVYLHFHWIFPYSLRTVPRGLQVAVYLFCCLLAVGELFLPIPKTLYFLAVVLTFGGSIGLLVLHYLFQPEYRREVRLLAVAAALALSPGIVLGIVSGDGNTPVQGPIALLSLPILPGAYFYVLYQRSLGQLELRANRAMSLAFFLVLLSIALKFAVGYLKVIPASLEASAFAAVVIALAAAFFGILVFPAFQSFVERRILGIRLPGQRLAEDYSARIVASESLPDLLKLLREEVFPSLLIRQYAFARNLQTSADILLAENVTQTQVKEEALLDWFASFSTGDLTLSSELSRPLQWVRLALPLRLGSELLGVWLLGRRDPDDLYSQAEVPILMSLANQTAVALGNLLKTEQIRRMYEANVLRHEQERQRLARDLHDSVLNELAALVTSADAPVLAPNFQAAYDGVTARLREIVSDLRPPMLNFGLRLAFEGLADNLMDRNQDSVQISAQIQTDSDFRYAESVEINLFRIVQESCQNAVRYAHAKFILIEGMLTADSISVAVLDDGIGFITATSLKLDEILAKKHFGLANMLERANLIGAEIQIESKPGQGTQVRVKWKAR